MGNYAPMYCGLACSCSDVEYETNLIVNTVAAAVKIPVQLHQIILFIDFGLTIVNKSFAPINC